MFSPKITTTCLMGVFVGRLAAGAGARDGAPGSVAQLLAPSSAARLPMRPMRATSRPNQVANCVPTTSQPITELALGVLQRTMIRAKGSFLTHPARKAVQARDLVAPKRFDRFAQDTWVVAVGEDGGEGGAGALE